MDDTRKPLWAAAMKAYAEGRIGPLPRRPQVRPESDYEMDLERRLTPAPERTPDMQPDNELTRGELLAAAVVMADMIDGEWPGPLSHAVSTWGSPTPEQMEAARKLEAYLDASQLGHMEH